MVLIWKTVITECYDIIKSEMLIIIKKHVTVCY